jgi:hypothetical protein
MLLRTGQEAREGHRLDDLDEKRIDPFTERIPMEFGQDVIKAVPEEIGAFAFLEKW